MCDFVKKIDTHIEEKSQVTNMNNRSHSPLVHRTHHSIHHKLQRTFGISIRKMPFCHNVNNYIKTF